MRHKIKTVFISRVKDVKDKRDRGDLEKLVEKISSCGIKDKYIVSKYKSDDKEKIASVEVQIIADDNPTSKVDCFVKTMKLDI